MIPRTLELEIIDSLNEAEEYDLIDHDDVNRKFVADLAKNSPLGCDLLDIGTGTAMIPIELLKLNGLAIPKETRVMAMDASQPMLELARYRIEVAGVRDRIQLHWGDGKKLIFANDFFDTVFSNSLVHHIPEPIAVFREAWRVLRPGGLLFFRDLIRPDEPTQVEQIVEQHAAGHSSEAKRMFRESLYAALRIDEVVEIANAVGLHHPQIERSSDRHWTLVARKDSDKLGSAST